MKWLSMMTERSQPSRNPSHSLEPDEGQNKGRARPTPIPPPARTAMGEYIIPPGGKALTSLETYDKLVQYDGLCKRRKGNLYPGPADYFPKTDLTRTEYPHFSLVGKPKSIDASRGKPGPADYNTSTDTHDWSNKKYTIKGRTRCYIDEEASKTNDILGKYNVQNSGVGKTGPHHKIGQRLKFKIFTGPPSLMIQAVDTHGFETPGPNYRPNSSYLGRGPKKSFGYGRKELHRVTSIGPGPGGYHVRVPPKGPAYSFGIKLPRTLSTASEGPGANEYDLGTTIGKGPSISISGRPAEITPALRVPSPSTYYPRDIFTSRATALSCKWPDSVDDSGIPKQPGPADYNIKYPHLPRNPSYTCRRRVKPTYPVSRLYQIKTEEETPSPAKYNVSNDIFHNDSPAHFIGERFPDIKIKNNNPAPNHYEVKKCGKPEAKTAPAYSMAKRIKSPQMSKMSAGPASYFPNISPGGPKFTMRMKPKSTKHLYTSPAPNIYKLPAAISTHNRGVLLKSRPSPYVYSGFRSQKTYQPKTIPSVPSMV